jgi:ubiquinone/menaquinone biosynthesis C-methylase UbiE
LIEAGGATDGDDVLDVGCGPGYLTKRLVRAVGAEGRLAGIDPSPEAIAYAKRGVPGKVDLRVAVAERLPYPDRSFDVVYCVLALHHIEPSQRLSALREMGRVLRADGTLLVAEFRPAPAADDSTDAIRDLTGLIAAAGFNVTGDGACHHRLRYVAAARS